MNKEVGELGGRVCVDSGSINCWREGTQRGVQVRSIPGTLPPANVSLLMRSPSIAVFSCRAKRMEM